MDATTFKLNFFCMTNLIYILLVMFYILFLRIKSCEKILIHTTVYSSIYLGEEDVCLPWRVLIHPVASPPSLILTQSQSPLVPRLHGHFYMWPQDQVIWVLNISWAWWLMRCLSLAWQLAPTSLWIYLCILRMIEKRYTLYFLHKEQIKIKLQ